MTLLVDDGYKLQPDGLIVKDYVLGTGALNALSCLSYFTLVDEFAGNLSFHTIPQSGSLLPYKQTCRGAAD